MLVTGAQRRNARYRVNCHSSIQPCTEGAARAGVVCLGSSSGGACRRVPPSGFHWPPSRVHAAGLSRACAG
eukprot:1566717-Prymnesium_polylepis.1